LTSSFLISYHPLVPLTMVLKMSYRFCTDHTSSLGWTCCASLSYLYRYIIGVKSIWPILSPFKCCKWLLTPSAKWFLTVASHDMIQIKTKWDSWFFLFTFPMAESCNFHRIANKTWILLVISCKNEWRRRLSVLMAPFFSFHLAMHQWQHHAYFTNLVTKHAVHQWYPTEVQEGEDGILLWWWGLNIHGAFLALPLLDPNSTYI